MDTSETIVAVASAPGRSARGIVRLSGANLHHLIERSLSNNGQSSLAVSRHAQPARFNLNGSLMLPVMALFARGPSSYTGEDVLELQAPGNPVLLERIVDRLIELGRRENLPIRHAEAGEFTARAFLNERIGLTEAEGVAATIAARSDAELRAAGMLRSGALGRLAHELADDLAGALALVEAGIDFTDEEDIVAISPADLHNRLTQLHERIAATLDRSVGMEQLEAIPWVVLNGPPNAGKSTLFNALLGRERAVVSDIAGTTRDVLMEPLALDLGGQQCEVMLVDLAGEDDDPATVNRLMQSAAADARARAELILYCLPAHEPLPDLAAGTITVRTKADLTRPHGAEARDGIVLSAITGEGVDALRALIAESIADHAVMMAGDLLALGKRHEALLRSAAADLAEAIALVEPIRANATLHDAELVAAAMRAALDDLGSLAGDITADDVLGRIFATFCVGK